MGSLADSRGRKLVLFACTAWGALWTLAGGLAPPNYALYFVFRLLTGIGAAGQALTTYILATESIGPGWRGLAGVATQAGPRGQRGWGGGAKGGCRRSRGIRCGRHGG